MPIPKRKQEMGRRAKRIRAMAKQATAAKVKQTATAGDRRFTPKIVQCRASKSMTLCASVRTTGPKKKRKEKELHRTTEDLSLQSPTVFQTEPEQRRPLQPTLMSTAPHPTNPRRPLRPGPGMIRATLLRVAARLRCLPVHPRPKPTDINKSIHRLLTLCYGLYALGVVGTVQRTSQRSFHSVLQRATIKFFPHAHHVYRTNYGFSTDRALLR